MSNPTLREAVLFGGGGHARAVADVVRRLGGRVLAVVAPEADGFGDAEVIAKDEDGANRARDAGCGVLGIGDNGVRLTLARRLLDAGAELPAVVASSATVADDADIGPGTVVLEHAHVGPRAAVGVACVVNTGAVVEHDVTLGDGAFVSPGAVVLGGVTCGAETMVGAGAVLLPYVSVGDGVVVGAGAVVRDDVPDGATVVGVPARSTAERRILGRCRRTADRARRTVRRRRRGRGQPQTSRWPTGSSTPPPTRAPTR